MPKFRIIVATLIKITPRRLLVETLITIVIFIVITVMTLIMIIVTFMKVIISNDGIMRGLKVRIGS